MSLKLPRYLLPMWLGAFVLFGQASVTLGQEDPPVDEDPPEEEEAPPEPLEILVYIEAHVDGVEGVDGLDGTYDMKLSPDGAFLYVASMNDDAIGIFSRNSETGELNYVSRTKNGEGGVTGLNGARSLDISPDGLHLYAVSMFDDSLVSFARDENTGALTFLGSIRDNDLGVDGLDGARSISISPDGLNLYVAGWDDNALALFSRNPVDGTVGFLGRLKHGEDSIYALDAPHFVTVAPDGENVYVVLWDEDAISIYDRDLDTGLLSYHSKIENEGQDVAGNPISGLQAPRAVLATPDGNQVYAVSWNDDALTAFNRDEAGALEFVTTHRNEVDGIDGLDGAHALAMSADGKFLYVAAFFDDAITVFSRDLDTGELTFDQSIFNSEEGVSGLNGTLTVMASPDGEHVYSASLSEKSLVAFRRELVIDPPVFTVEPIAKSIPANSSVSFNALAEGVEVSYQWKADGANISGANDSTLVIDPVAFALDQTVYTVEASNPGGAVLSAEALLTVLPEISLETPESLTALTQSSTTSLLEWQDLNENETGFEIQRKVAGGVFETIAQVFAYVSEYSDSSLDPGTEYIYRLRATRPGEVSEWSNEAVIESFDSVPNGPANLRIALESYNRVELQWSDRSAVEDGYTIERRDDSAGTGFEVVGSVETSRTQYIDRGLDSENAYSYRVRAYNESGPSEYSDDIQANTIENPVNSLSPESRTVTASESLGNFVGVGSMSEWEAIPSVDWLLIQTPEGGSGFGDEGMTYRVLENTGLEERIGEIDIGGLIHTVTQEGADEVLLVAPSDSRIVSQGGQVTLSITANIPWAASSSAPWIAFDSETVGENSGSVAFTVAENPDLAERIGQVWVNEVVHTVTQEGLRLYTTFDPVAQTVPGSGGEYSFSILSNTTWALEESAEWLSIETATSGQGDAAVRLTLSENISDEPRSAIIRANEATHTVTQSSTNLAGEPPRSPEGGASDENRVDGILITWIDNSDFELGYIIERANRDSEDWTEIARTPADSTSYLDTTVEPGVAHTYRVSAYNEEGVSAPVYIDSEGMQLRSRLANLSARAFVGTGSQALIAGFAIEGEDRMELFARSVGPKLEDFQVDDTLVDPLLNVQRFPEGTEVASNDDWIDSMSELELTRLEGITGAFSIATSLKDAAVLGEYDTGVYTALLEDSLGDTGVALLELYEVTGEAKIDARLTNLSARGYVGRGAEVMIGGFTILGAADMRLLIRGIGPDLSNREVRGALSDPFLQLNSNGEVLFENDDWDDVGAADLTSAFVAAGAGPLIEGSKDSAMIVTLGEGVYTVIMSGVSSSTGVGLFEIFVLD